MATIFATKNPDITPREKNNMAISREAAGECMVLLENNGALPLKKGSTIALFGSGARQTVRGGTGSGDVNTRFDVNIEQGLENAGFIVCTKEWLDQQDEAYERAYNAHLKWIPAYAKEQGLSEVYVNFTHPFQVIAPSPIEGRHMAKADACVYVISRTSGEFADRTKERGDYKLYKEELEQLKALAEVYARIVVILNVGGVMDLSEIKEIQGIDAILLMGQLGNLGGDALADVLSGAVVPSGKLVDTWAKDYSDYPAAAAFGRNDGDVDDEYYKEGIYVGYRYFDSFGVKPLYPFGYGLSYTRFDIVLGATDVNGTQVTTDVVVTNIGDYPGKEVIQLYVSAPQGKLHKPYQELKAFKKTKLLKPGETQIVKISFDASELASYSEEDAAWILEKGCYQMRIGDSSAKTQKASSLELSRDVKTCLLKNLFKDPVKLEEIKPAGLPEADEYFETDLLDPDAFKTESVDYTESRDELTTEYEEKLTLTDVLNGRCMLSDVVAQLSVEEMAELCVGTSRASGGSVVGSVSSLVPGAAGDTSSVIYESRGFRNLSLADGPAGLRLQPVFKTDKQGNLLPGGRVIRSVAVPFDPSLNDSNSDTYYQYCTAIPIGWSLAMSWNMDLLEDLGDMVGGEMELFGVDVWLAPALNIHRDPLCGRNFEYYSEDPLIAGEAAAAITNGVQKHHGKGVSIKHFAANNQEENRFFSNSHISERALREIYLKGFEICVKKAYPRTVMSSYNLLNGVHTANNRDLLQNVLRDEWGYYGMVMTDWYTSQNMPQLMGKDPVKYPISASTGCIYAGNDVQMPGCQGNVDDIVRAVKTGEEIDGYKISLADLQAAAHNVLRCILRSW